MRHLDVGVGDGYTIRLLKPEGAVVGIDTDEGMKQHAVDRGIDFKLGSAYRIPFPDSTFELVTCIEVIEHLKDPYGGLEEAMRVLKPRGFLVITTPVPKLSWRILWWGWTHIGPGKRWETTPHVAELGLHGTTGKNEGLESMFKRLRFGIEATATCNAGFIAGVRVAKISGASSES